MKEVQITRGRVTQVDDSDYADLSRHKWCTTARGYVMRRTRKAEDMGGVCIYMHRYIMREELLENPSIEVDHEDGNPLNNQRSNLRLGTHQQNCFNQKTQKRSESGYKGVTFMKADGNWRARIKVNKRFIHLGRFPTKELAALAYNEASLKYHGEFGRLNKIISSSPP